jgi:hypothetical protein
MVPAQASEIRVKSLNRDEVCSLLTLPTTSGGNEKLEVKAVFRLGVCAVDFLHDWLRIDPCGTLDAVDYTMWRPTGPVSWLIRWALFLKLIRPGKTSIPGAFARTKVALVLEDALIRKG